MTGLLIWRIGQSAICCPANRIWSSFGLVPKAGLLCAVLLAGCTSASKQAGVALDRPMRAPPAIAVCVVDYNR
ncbi:MAG TPA: hypothetical protein VGH74_15655, partial [Planctomycetaceae bacterium]